MPSVSKAQQRFMGLVHAYKKGEVPASQVSQAVKDAAKSMKKKSTKKMASTKHKGLPNKVRSENMNEDGHTDVASAERKLKLIMKDAMDTLNALKNLSNEDSLPSWWTDKITLAKDYVGKSRDYIMNPAESVNERISVSDERHFGKKGIIIMIDDNGKKVSAIFKDKKNADKFNRNKPADIKKLLQLAKKTKYPKAIDESINEDITSAGYFFLRKAAYGIGVALKDLNKGIKRQNDKIVLNEIDYIYDKVIDMKRMLKNKKYNESVNEKVIKVSKKDDIPGNPMKMKGEEKIKKLTYSGSVGMDKPGSYEIKGNKLNVNNIRPRDKGFFVRHFTMGTGFRKANLYYDGVHWQGGKKF